MLKKKKYIKGLSNRHHILNKCRHGSNHSDNIYIMDIGKHVLWHHIFRWWTFEEAAEALEKVPDLVLVDADTKKDFEKLFGHNDTDRAINQLRNLAELIKQRNEVGLTKKEEKQLDLF